MWRSREGGRDEKSDKKKQADKWQTYPPSDVCGSVWWSVCGWPCLECVSEWGRGRDWAPLRVSDKDGASRLLSAGYSCITAPSWAPSLLQDWQLQWKILSTSLSTRGDSSLPGHSRVTCAHTNTHIKTLFSALYNSRKYNIEKKNSKGESELHSVHKNILKKKIILLNEWLCN